MLSLMNEVREMPLSARWDSAQLSPFSLHLFFHSVPLGILLCLPLHSNATWLFISKPTAADLEA